MGLIMTLFLLVGTGTDPSINAGPELPRSQRLAPLFSFLLPGTGELIRGYPAKGEILLWIDGVTIAGVAGFGWDAIGKRNASVSMALIHADANPLNKSHKYLVAMEQHNSTEEYVASITREARSLFEDDLVAQQEYIERNSFPAEDQWLWESDSLRLEYLEERNDMRLAWRTSQTLMGIMLLTRIVSVFDVGFFSPPKESRLGLETLPDPRTPGVQLIYRF